MEQSIHMPGICHRFPRTSLHVEVVADFTSPACFLGKRYLDRALALLECPGGPVLDWHPLELHPEHAPGGMEVEAFLSLNFGGRQNAQPLLEKYVNRGRAVGIEFQFDRIRRVPSTLDAHRLIHRVRDARLQHTLAEHLFSAYFEQGRDIGNRHVLMEIAEEAGLVLNGLPAFLGSAQARDTVRGIETLHRQQGMSGLPHFTFNGQVTCQGAESVNALLVAMDVATFGPGSLRPGVQTVH